LTIQIQRFHEKKLEDVSTIHRNEGGILHWCSESFAGRQDQQTSTGMFGS
jgi:hypothetical protein